MAVSGQRQSEEISNDRAWVILREAAEEYKKFSYDRVIRLTENLLQCEDATRDEMVVALSISGASAYLLDTNELAEGYILEALGLDPGLRLDSNIYPMAILRLFERIKAGH